MGIRFVFPHAPMRPVTINGGFVMRAWYDIVYQDLAMKEDEPGVRQSQDDDRGTDREESNRAASPRAASSSPDFHRAA